MSCRNIIVSINFSFGNQHGKKNQYFKEESKDIVTNFQDGKKHGLKEQYYASGNLETRTTYVDGLIEGVHIYLKEDGEVVEEKIMQKCLDITMELMQLMMEIDAEHMLNPGFIKDGVQEFQPGQVSQELYDYYKSNDLRVESAEVSSLISLYKEGKITKDFYDMSMSVLG